MDWEEFVVTGYLRSLNDKEKTLSVLKKYKSRPWAKSLEDELNRK